MRIHVLFIMVHTPILKIFHSNNQYKMVSGTVSKNLLIGLLVNKGRTFYTPPIYKIKKSFFKYFLSCSLYSMITKQSQEN